MIIVNIADVNKEIIMNLNKLALNDIHNVKLSTSNSNICNIVLDTEDMFNGEKLITIKHGDNEYLLRITRQDKLILTK